MVQQFNNLIDLLQQTARDRPDKIAYTFLNKKDNEEISIDYQELDRQARAIATILQNRKTRGERVLLLYQPGLEFIAAFFGCLYAEAIAVPVYSPKRDRYNNPLQAIIADAEATVVLTTTAILSNFAKNLKSEPILTNLDCITTDNIDCDLACDWQIPHINKDTLAFLQYTSGSTGTPKGVMVSHGNLLHNQRLIQQGFGHTSDTIVVGWLPVYHDMGLIGNILQPLYLGIPCIMMSPMMFLQRPILWLQTISRYKATTSGAPNFAYDLCVDKIKPEQLADLDLSSWQVAFTGAEPVRAATLERFARTFSVCGFRREAFYPCYGMAETTLFVSGGLQTEAPIIRLVDGTELSKNRVVFTDDSDTDALAIVGCGGSWLEQKIAIVDPQSLTECRDKEVGEIWVSGESVTQGYWKKPNLTQQAFNASIQDRETEAFFRTGDMGFIDNGELFITGRIKDVIIIRGQNHYPQDIELTVQKSHPALQPASGAAFSVEIKGEERLVIVQEVKRTYLRNLNVKEVVGNIVQATREQHGLQVYTAILVKTGSIPKTSSGKIQRHACKDRFLKGNLPILQDLSKDPAQKVDFQHLQTDVTSLLNKVQINK